MIFSRGLSAERFFAYNSTMSTNTNHSSLIERLFKVGAHFGFKKSRRHPTVTPYLYGTKDGNDIFDLEKSAVLLDAAKQVITEAGMNGKVVLFVGTKVEVVKLVKAAALKVEMPYVVNRWIGGMMTNFSEIKKRLARLAELSQGQESGELERKYTKKERLVLSREADKLQVNFMGISQITKTPDLLVVVDPRHDHIAIKEAHDMKVPIIAIMSSDCDVSKVTYPILVNDALQGSVGAILDDLVAALQSGKAAYSPKPVTARPTDSKPTTPSSNPAIK
jgi:small subunit ribosomal protein S2